MFQVQYLQRKMLAHRTARLITIKQSPFGSTTHTGSDNIIINIKKGEKNTVKR